MKISNWLCLIIHCLIRKFRVSTRILFLLLLCGWGVQSGIAQTSATPPNVYTPVTTDTYNNLTVTNSTGILGGDEFSNHGNLIDSNLNNASSTSILVGSAWIQVTDDNATDPEIHPSGSYVGFVVDDALLGVGSGYSVTIYNNGTEVETVSAGSIISTDLGGGQAKIGFFASGDFDTVRFTYDAGLALGTVNVYYAEILTPDASASPDLGDFCNEPVPWVQGTVDETEDGFPVVIEPARTGGSGITLGDISNLENVINNDTDDSASMVSLLGLASSVSLSVRTLGDVVPGGSFAGFNVSTDAILSVGLLDEITITTYLNGIEQDNANGDGLIASADLLGASGRYIAGFQTENDFDEIQITMNDGLLSLDLSVFDVYHAVVQNFCEGAALVCRTDTPISTPDYPVFINYENTGVSGAVSACLLGDCIEDADYLINGNPNEGAVITQLASGVGSASIAVKFGEGSFAGAGNDLVFVGFDIENSSLLDVDVIDGITITTYLDGAEQESSEDAGGTLVEANTDLIAGNERRTVGFAATDEFNEVQLSIENVLGVALDETTVYQLILRELCPGPFVPCGETAILEQETYPVIINSERTGFFGAACAGCAVEDADALISADDTDFATITSTVDLLNYASVSVLNPVDTYPANTTVGFIIDTNTSNLVELDLFDALEICTYNNGTEQECNTGSDLLSLTLLIPLIGPADGIFNVGFATTLPYDEIVLRTGDLATANVTDGVIDVYSSFIDFHAVDSDGDTCPDITITLLGGSCYRMLSSPVAGLTYRDMLDGLWTQGFSGSDYLPGGPNVFTWPLDEPGDTDAGWSTLADLDAEIPGGTGFLISVFEDDEYGTPGTFPKTITIPAGPQNSSVLPGSMMNENPGGWTLVGNPLQSNIALSQLTTNHLTGSFYVYDRNAGGETNENPGSWLSNAAGFGDITDGAIAVGQGFFVQNVSGGPVDPSIIFEPDATTSGGQFYGKEKQERKDYVRFELNGESSFSSAWIRFSGEGSFESIYGDAVKLYPFASEYAVLSIRKPNNSMLDIGHYPMPAGDETISIPLHVDATIPGTYTLSATDFDLSSSMALYLRDTETGNVMEINDKFEYTFNVAMANKSPDHEFVCSDAPKKVFPSSQARFMIVNNISVPNENEIPSEVMLGQNFPNPFNPATVINYQLPASMNVSLQVFDITGRRVAILEEGNMPAGRYTVTFDASNLSSGVYIYSLQTGNEILTRKLTLIK